jgi:hypothetical protein
MMWPVFKEKFPALAGETAARGHSAAVGRAGLLIERVNCHDPFRGLGKAQPARRQ